MLDDGLVPTVVPLAETSEEIEMILELVATPHQGLSTIKVQTLRQGLRLGDLVDKYNIWRVDAVVVSFIRPRVAKDPLLAFIWACKHRNIIVARLALSKFAAELWHLGKIVSVVPWQMDRTIALQFDLSTFFAYNKVCLANLMEGPTCTYSTQHTFAHIKKPLKVCNWEKVAEQFTFE